MEFINGVMNVPAGDSVITTPIIFPDDKPSLIKGEGIEVSRIIVDASQPGIIGSFSNFAHKSIRDLTLVCSRDSYSPAINLSWPFAYSINDPTLLIHNVRIAPEPSVSPGIGWRAGIRLNHCWNGSISNVLIHGDNSNNDHLWYGLQVDGRSMDMAIDNLKIFGAQTGIEFLGDCEGPMISHSLMMSCRIGLRSSTTAERPWLALHDSHIAARRIGVLLEQRAQATIHDNLIYRGPTSENGFVGIYLSGSQDARVLGNQIYILGNPMNQTNYGIVITVPTGIISDNIIRSASVPIYKTVDGAIIEDNFIG